MEWIASRFMELTTAALVTGLGRFYPQGDPVHYISCPFSRSGTCPSRWAVSWLHVACSSSESHFPFRTRVERPTAQPANRRYTTSALLSRLELHF
ncbi:hypothetical protein J6590_076816 [Homalodisca vitripennis]|nr:hypothetical protein J6590_076816 [Homalodisca vitripennis]